MKTTEEIRKDLGMTQERFAAEIGLSIRGYQNKISGKREWRLCELIEASRLNNGHVRIEEGGDVYDITIKEGR